MSLGLSGDGGVFELVEFSLDRVLQNGVEKKGIYGVNVEKVREVVRMPAINPLSSQMPGFAGIFELRGVPIPAVNLSAVLGDVEAPLLESQQIIITEFSQKRAGFVVSSTHRIRRVTWDKIMSPAADTRSCICGMSLIENNEFLFILDLEKILLSLEKMDQKWVDEEGDIAGQVKASKKPVNGMEKRKKNNYSILLVDDSNLVLKSASSYLDSEGYDVIKAMDGKQAIQVLEKVRAGEEKVDLVITDIEMPRMDGLSLTRWIREDEKFTSMPILIHSSLSGMNTQKSGIEAGANGYILKNDLSRLKGFLTEILG